MRRLLACLITTAVGIVAGLLQGSEATANHSSYPVYAYVYHPTGNSTSNAQLNCGWHDICDGIFSDASKKGLDWVYPGNVSYTVWLRVRILGGSGVDWAGRAQSYNAPTGCKRIWSDLYRVNWSYIGAVANQHSQAAGTNYFNLYASGGGYNNEGVIGSMLQSGDNCQSSGPHTMQWYTNSSGGSVSKNTSGLPLESGCVLCGWQYNRWATYEWLFTYWTAP